MDGRRSTSYAASQTARIQSLAPLPASLPAPRRRSRQCLQPVPVVAGSGAAPAPLIYLLSKPGSGRKRGPPWAIGANALASQPCFARSPTRRPCCFTLPSFVPSFLSWPASHGNRRMGIDEEPIDLGHTSWLSAAGVYRNPCCPSLTADECGTCSHCRSL